MTDALPNRETLTTLRATRKSEFEADRVLERRIVRAALLALVVTGLATMAAVDRLLPLPWPAVALVGLGGVVFLILARERATTRRLRRDFAVQALDDALARLDDRFDLGRPDGHDFQDEQHPYSGDLDVFGKGALFPRLAAARTFLGLERLARWISGTPAGRSMTERQAAIRELAGDLAWRERLEIALRDWERFGGRSPVERERLALKTRELLAWAAEPAAPPDSAPKTTLISLLGLAALTALVLCASGVFEWALFLPFYLVNFVVLATAKDLDETRERFEAVDETLDAWAEILDTIEKAPHRAELLVALRAPLLAGGGGSSAALRRLRSRVGWLAQHRNLFWRLTAGVIGLADLHARRGVLSWQRRHGAQVGPWFRAAADYEAAFSLATYAAAVPGDAWPETAAEGPLLSARDLAHPLLARANRVGNDLDLGAVGDVLLVTGSNMSGKSTLLRAAGLAAVMADAGLPVAARSLRLRPLSVVTCMRVHDAIDKGSSRFHAEVTRLKLCIDLVTDDRLTLVLLDEILAGTNSPERHEGTLAVLRSLAKRQAVTLLATHDLSLASLADEFPTKVRLTHFRDLIQQNRMVFDYKMREGPCPATNALRVMRQVGLDVPLPPAD